MTGSRHSHSSSRARTDGSGYVFYKGRPLAFSFVGHMNLFTVLGGIANQQFYRAVRKVPKGDAVLSA